MIKYIRNITGEVTLTNEGQINVLNIQSEYGEGDYIKLHNHIGFYQNLERATKITELVTPEFLGLNNNGKIMTTIEISY
jgi:hypothetical protein